MGKLQDSLLRSITGMSQKELDRVRSGGRSEKARHGSHRKRVAAIESENKRMDREAHVNLKKIKKRSEAGVERVRFDQVSVPKQPTSLGSLPVYGVLMPMAHGKSTLAQAEGWIDCDSLIAPGMKRELIPGVLSSLGDGCDYEEAFCQVSAVMAKSLEILAPSKPTLVLTNNLSLLERCSIPCLAIMSLENEAFEYNLRLREEPERYAARISKAYLEACEQPGRPLIMAQDNSSMRTMLYQIAESMGLDLGAPRELNPEAALPVGVGWSSSCSLTKLADLHDKGQISTALFNYQINLQGLKSYRGCGFTMNDWASVAAQLVDTTPLHDPSIPGLGKWPISLEAIGKHFDLSEDQDAQALMMAHGGEDEAFTVGLLLHWKLYGLRNDTTGRLRLLYYVRRAKWDGVMRKVRQGVLASNTFMGEPLTLLERDILLSLHMLSCTTTPALISKWRDEKMGYPSGGPSRALMTGYREMLSSLLIELPDIGRHYTVEAWKYLTESPLEGMKECVAALSSNSRLRRKHVIAFNLGAKLLSNWDGEQGSGRIVKDAMKQVVANWFRMGRIRDEWFDFIGQILDDECAPDDQLSQMVVGMVAPESCQGLSGTSWGGKVADAIQRLVVVGWCGKQLGQRVALQRLPDGISPVVLGNTESEYVREIMKMGAPKYINSSGNEDSVLATVAELVDWSRSGVGLVLELVNAGTWLGHMTRKQQMGLLSNWALKRETKGVDVDGLQSVLGRFSKAWMGRRFSERLCKDLETFTHLSRHDGGLGSADIVMGGSVAMGPDQKTWDGHSRVILNGRGTHRVNKVDLVASRRTLNPDKPSSRWSAMTLSLSGALVSCFLLGGERSDAEALCRSVESLKEVRPWALQHVRGARASMMPRRVTSGEALEECIDRLVAMAEKFGN
ncbi:hypothetical protein [Penicillium roseopurpureum chrysovirus 1]|nr:hypothetical protein [Penicillium roseopurpureum chrysovirus 1]